MPAGFPRVLRDLPKRLRRCEARIDVESDHFLNRYVITACMMYLESMCDL